MRVVVDLATRPPGERRGECPRDSFCPVHPAWVRIQAVLLRELEAVTAQDLAAAAAMHGNGGNRQQPAYAGQQREATE